MSHLKVAYVINDASFFVSHRLPIALKVMKKGGEVCLISGINHNADLEKKAIQRLKEEGIQHYLCKFSQGFKNPLIEFYGILQVVFYLKSFKPTTLHSATAKANLVSAIACNFSKQKKLILSISGMGTMFIGKQKFKKKIFKIFFKFLIKLALKSIKFEFIFQNKQDYQNYKSILNFNDTQANFINGSGVDTNKLKPSKKITKPKKILLPARILYEKGIGDFVNASKILKKQNCNIDFLLAGDTESLNPSSIDKKLIKYWDENNFITYLGYQQDTKKMYDGVSVVCLPSWREGFPKVLLEAASLGLPVITTDVPGCRDAVIENKTGLIVPAQNPEKLADAIKKLFKDNKLMRKMGKEGRLLAIRKYDFNIILPQIIKLYE